MKLEKIVLNGFKSFADKTEFIINQQIIAIVGPNGCGKSNVVDAVKWVLGNQSPKSLRSGHMSDVIFSGSSSRKASGVSEVSLFFSEVHSIGIEQESLQITRRLYRSGESEYLINNKICRLKDIRELFMDTGIGVSAYSIIEQGQIDQLLHASKVDRRIIFEEAAGISKFKAHKKEALRKLERTEQNLLRLADIVSEVGRQLRSIKLQAGKARNYLLYSEKLKELRVNYSLAEYHKIITRSKEKQENLAQLKDKLSHALAEVTRLDTNMSQLNNSILESEGRINKADNSLITVRGKIEQQYERIELLNSRISELQQRKQSAANQIEQLNLQNSQLQNELSSCNTLQKENESLLKDKNSKLDEIQGIISHINAEQRALESNLVDEKSGIIDLVRRTAQLHNEIESINTYRSNLTGQKDRLNGRASDAETQLAQLLTDKAQHQRKLDEITELISELQQRLDESRSQMEQIESNLKNSDSQLLSAKEKRSALVGELNVLADMEAKRQGLSDTIKNILHERKQNRKYEYVEGIVADIISAQPDCANIVEAALEGMTDAVVINSSHKFIEDKTIDPDLKSRVKLICADRIRPFADTVDLSKYDTVKCRVIEMVKFKNIHATLAWSLLGKTLLVDSIASAVKLTSELGRDYKFVTPEGKVFDGKKVLNVGPLRKAAGLISRKSRITELENQLAEINTQIENVQGRLDQDNAQNDRLGKLCKDFRTSIYEANTEKVNAESYLNLLKQNITRLKEEQPLIAGEIEMLEEQIRQSVQKEYDSKQKLEELEQINQQRSEHIAELEAQIAQKKSTIESTSAELTELKIEIGQITEQQNSIKQQTAGLQSQLHNCRLNLDNAEKDLRESGQNISQTERDVLSSQTKISDLFCEKEKAQKASIQLHQMVEHLLSEQKATEENLKQSRTRQSEIEQQMHEVELALSQLSVKNEDLTERVAEELQIDLAQAYENFQQENVDWDQVQAEIADLRAKIERLGNVNVDAIKEQDELEQRYDFLTKQVEDLDKSKAQLEQLISKINKESHDKFITTFENVRQNFQELFRKLFGGGKADILLEDPDDILECGIEIIARPPGKETRSISLLSGGEKTLTALGLLFAVFKTKPSPFCFLDEVDAALDEANNERFNLIVQEFKRDSQFVIITHSKRTMSIADVLFGVTMQTQGVSKKISVQFDSVETEDSIAVA